MVIGLVARNNIKEWGAYMNKYPAWAAENSQYEGADPVYAGMEREKGHLNEWLEPWNSNSSGRKRQI